MALVLEDEWPPVQDLAACPKLAPLSLLSLSPRSPLCSPPLSPNSPSSILKKRSQMELSPTSSSKKSVQFDLPELQPKLEERRVSLADLLIAAHPEWEAELEKAKGSEADCQKADRACTASPVRPQPLMLIKTNGRPYSHPTTDTRNLVAEKV